MVKKNIRHFESEMIKKQVTLTSWAIISFSRSILCHELALYNKLFNTARMWTCWCSLLLPCSFSTSTERALWTIVASCCDPLRCFFCVVSFQCSVSPHNFAVCCCWIWGDTTSTFDAVINCPVNKCWMSENAFFSPLKHKYHKYYERHISWFTSWYNPDLTKLT